MLICYGKGQKTRLGPLVKRGAQVAQETFPEIKGKGSS